MYTNRKVLWLAEDNGKVCFTAALRGCLVQNSEVCFRPGLLSLLVLTVMYTQINLLRSEYSFRKVKEKALVTSARS